jgi:uncharacterized surface protein with fasciclin (FAS1) repeats
MNKHSLSIRTGLAMVISLFAFNSCSDNWNEHYDVKSGLSSNLTLWEHIVNDSTLSDFRDIVGKTKVSTNHKVLSISYEDVFNSDQTYTVWAPVNGSFNKDSLLDLCSTEVGNLAVERGFILNHMVRYAYSVNSSTARTMVMLNDKKKYLTETKMGEAAIIPSNIQSKNGILYKIDGEIPFYPSIYEGVTTGAETSMLGSYLKSYQKDTLIPSLSVASEIVDGKTIYVDSVMLEYNGLFNYIGDINSEDSVYQMIAPTNIAWEDAYKKTAEYFKYPSTTDQADSLKAAYAKLFLVGDLVFNPKMQTSVLDSIVSLNYYSYDPKYHVFYKPYAAGGILSEIKDSVKCSNGTIYRVDKWPFTKFESFFYPITVEAEYSSHVLQFSQCNLNPRYAEGDSISEHGYMDIVPIKTIDNPTITFEIPNTMSGKYDVCVVCVPKNVYKIPKNAADSADNSRQYKFKAVIGYADLKGLPKTYKCGNDGTFSNNPYIVDTVCVAKSFEFPACNYNQTTATTTLKIQSFVTTPEMKFFSREMFIDCIYLRPTE